MKKTLLLTIILTISISFSAFSQFSCGWKVATGTKTDKIKDYSLSNASYMGGLSAEFTIPIIGIGLGADVLLSSTQKEYTQQSTYNTENKDKRYFSLLIPLNLKYKIGVPIFKVVFSFGPYIEMPLGNKMKDDLGIDHSENCNIYGVNTSIGFETIKHFQMHLGYYFDTKFNNKTMEDRFQKNKGFYLSMFFAF